MARPSAREKLLDCAEQLFAEHGLSGVSLRAINAEAGLSPAALHYHFGSQQVLVEALLERRMPALMSRRSELLDALERSGRAPTARGVLEALSRPLTELLCEAGDSGVRYLRMIQRLQADGDLDPHTIRERHPAGVGRLAPLLRKALPSLDETQLRLRLALAIDVMLRSLALAPVDSREALDFHTSALLDFLTGALEAPSTGAPA